MWLYMESFIELRLIPGTGYVQGIRASHHIKIRKLHPLWGVHHCIHKFSTRSYIQLSPMLSSPANRLDSPSTRDGHISTGYESIFFGLGVVGPFKGQYAIQISEYIAMSIIICFGRFYFVLRFRSAFVKLQ